MASGRSPTPPARTHEHWARAWAGSARLVRPANSIPDSRRHSAPTANCSHRSSEPLLDGNFPPSLHAELLIRLGLELDTVEIADTTRRRRDPAFRNTVLIAYEYRCAMCGYDGWLSGEAIGLDAAHIRWWAIQGPDTIDNALCLCALHHRLFDRGVEE